MQHNKITLTVDTNNEQELNQIINQLNTIGNVSVIDSQDLHIYGNGTKTAYIHINTDDDAEIVFRGKSYCYYSDSFNKTVYFETNEQLIQFLNEIHVKNNLIGVPSLIQSVLNYWINGQHDKYINGNQTMRLLIL